MRERVEPGREQVGVALRDRLEPELRAEQLEKPRPKGGFVRGQCGAGFGLRNERGKRGCERVTIPETDRRLPFERVASAGIGMVANEFRLVLVEETVWAVVERQAQDRHVVRVEDAVREADGLPFGKQAGRP